MAHIADRIIRRWHGRAYKAGDVMAALAVLGAAVALNPAVAAEPTPADVAWIDKCVADREREISAGQMQPRSALLKYCTCMRAIVQDGEPLSIAELERRNPPVQETCLRR